MPDLICNLKLGIQSGLCRLKPKLSLRLSQTHAHSEAELACTPTSTSLSEQHLQHIIQQVRAEGFDVESLSIFCYGNLTPSEAISAIERWATEVGLKVSFNHEHQLCFFEKG